MAAIYQCVVYACVLCVSVSMSRSVYVCLYACIVIWMIGVAAVLKSRCVCVCVCVCVCACVRASVVLVRACNFSFSFSNLAQ